MEYSKPALTTEQMIEKLKKRGMIFADENVAVRKLSHINYYRLSAYWFPYLVDKDVDEGIFATGTTFESMIDQYEFDKKLRAEILNSIELIEVSVRRTWASSLGLEYGAFAHLQASIMKDRNIWHTSTSRLQNEYNKSREEFIRHHHDTYPDLLLPPIWVTSEITTIGSLFHLIDNLKELKDKKIISRHYHLDEDVFTSFLRHISDIRNICAHHGRLWNKKHTRRFQMPKSKNGDFKFRFNRKKYESNKIYNTIEMLAYFEYVILGAETIRTRLSDLFKEFPLIDKIAMGYPRELVVAPDTSPSEGGPVI